MAESWRARANRYVRGDFTKAELMGAVGVLLVDQAIDIATFGRLSKLKGKAFVKVALPLVRKAVPIAARTGLGVGVTGVGSVRMLALRHPVATGLAVAYVAYTQRDKIQALLEQGYEIIEEPVVQPVSQFLQEEVFTPEAAIRAREVGTIGSPFAARARRRPSSFNKAVSAGMRVIKKSTSYGKKGEIKPAKKAFTVVVKLAAAKMKKKKAPKTGIRRRIWNAMKGLR